MVPLRERKGGVYIAAFGGARMTALVVGQTQDLGATIAELAVREDIAAFRRYGDLFVTWRVVPRPERAGLVRYLHATLHPVLDETCPVATPRPTMLPKEFG